MRSDERKVHKLNEGEAMQLRLTVDVLTHQAARRALLGIINAFSRKNHLPIILFEEILADARKLTLIQNQKGTSSVEYALLVVMIAAACLLAVGLLGDTVRQLFQAAAGLFQYLR